MRRLLYILYFFDIVRLTLFCTQLDWQGVARIVFIILLSAPFDISLPRSH